MKTSDFKKGKKVKLIPWKTALKLYRHENSNNHICVPYGDNNGNMLWVKTEYNEFINKILIMMGIDIDGDIIITYSQVIQPRLLISVTSPISFKAILANN